MNITRLNYLIFDAKTEDDVRFVLREINKITDEKERESLKFMAFQHALKKGIILEAFITE